MDLVIGIALMVALAAAGLVVLACGIGSEAWEWLP